jgi:hypothetical protein
MSGYYGRRGGYSRRPSAPKDGRIERANKYAGPCHYCGSEVPAGSGQLFGQGGQWRVVHLAMRWAGSPVSGGYTGGCPGEAAAKNAAGNFGTPDVRAPELVSVPRRGKCEDAPCCGCCD